MHLNVFSKQLLFYDLFLRIIWCIYTIINIYLYLDVITKLY